VTASNLLFLLPEPLPALLEMKRVLKPQGQIALLNPSENLSSASAAQLAERRGLQGPAYDSLIEWGRRAETNQRWTEAELKDLLAGAGLELVETQLKVGTGMARFARAVGS
jgi:hypothetical protein